MLLKGKITKCSSVIVECFFDEQLQKNADFCNCWPFLTDNYRCATVAPFFEQQWHKNADMCNCWSIFKPTMAQPGVHVFAISRKNVHRNADLCNFSPKFPEKMYTAAGVPTVISPRIDCNSPQNSILPDFHD